MPHHPEALHHHARKKRHQARSHGPVSRRFIDRAIYVVGLFGPIMTIPQLSKIWIQKNATGVSAVSWAAYIIVAVFWILYGMVHKERPLVVLSSIWIVLEVFIVTGTILYG